MIIIIHEIGVRVYLTLPSSAWHHPFWLLDLSSGHIFCIPQIYPVIAIYWIYPLVPFGNQTWQRNIPSFWLIFPFQPPCIGDFPLPGVFFFRMGRFEAWIESIAGHVCCDYWVQLLANRTLATRGDIQYMGVPKMGYTMAIRYNDIPRTKMAVYEADDDALWGEIVVSPLNLQRNLK